MKEFVKIVVKPYDNLFGAFLTCKIDSYEWWLLRSYASTPAEAVQNVCNYFLMDDWSSVGNEIEVGIRLKDIVCPQCQKDFILSYCDYKGKEITLNIRSCPSGGIYNVLIECPHCNYVEEL